MYHVRTSLACANIRFSSLFVAEEVSRGKKSESKSAKHHSEGKRRNECAEWHVASLRNEIIMRNAIFGNGTEE